MAIEFKTLIREMTRRDAIMEKVRGLGTTPAVRALEALMVASPDVAEDIRMAAEELRLEALCGTLQPDPRDEPLISAVLRESRAKRHREKAGPVEGQ